MTHRPYVYYTYSPALRGRAREFGYSYAGHRVVETADGQIPVCSHAKTVVRVVRDDGGVCTGSTERSQGVRNARDFARLANHRNLLHQVRLGIARVTLAQIADETNAELQRELIEHYDGSGRGIEARTPGWETYLEDVAAAEIATDETGTLIEIATAANEPIRAVRVTCPSTGRQYALRVPPQTKTAHEGVSWTFGLRADQYQPTAQS